MSGRLLNVNVQNTTATGGSSVFAGVNIQGDFVTGESSLQERVIRWLNPIDPHLVHDQLVTQRAPETGEAFLNTQFQQWLASEARLLWLHGEGGSGKTFLSSLLVDRTASMLSKLDDNENCDHIVAFFYCSFQESATQEPTNFLKSVNAQLFVKHKNFKQLIDLYEKKRPMAASQDELRTALAAIATNPEPEPADQDNYSEHSEQTSSTTTLIIDGFDEVPSGPLQTQYFSMLSSLAKLNAPRFRIIVVSRYLNVITHHFTNDRGWTWMSRTDTDVEADIDLFNLDQISQNYLLRDQSEGTKLSIRRQLGQGRKGMFRLAALQMQELCINTEALSTIDEDQINHFLESLPRELDPFYDRIVARIPQAVQASLKAALQWVTFASRPLFVEELVAACAIEHNRSGCPSSVGKQIVGVSVVVERLRGMVELQPSPTEDLSNLALRRYTFRLVHQTVREYLFPTSDVGRPAGRIRFEGTIAHTYLAQCCLVYLSHCARQRDGRSSAYSFRSYAWHSWAVHFTWSTDLDAAEACLKSTRLHNSIMHPTLYEADGDLAQDTSNMVAKLQDFLGFLAPVARAPLQAVIRDASFPSNIPEEDGTRQVYWERAGDYPGFLRLVIIHPSEKYEDEVECTLINDFLDNCPRYEVLSYNWGNRRGSKLIHVNGCEFWTSGTTVVKILQTLRSKTEYRVFWIQSISINISQSVLRPQQMASMVEVYGNASRSVVYIDHNLPHARGRIGEELAYPSHQREPSTSEAVDGTLFPLDLERQSTRASRDRSADSARCLEYILRNPLWRKISIMQEMMWSNETLCHFGPDAVPWDDLVKRVKECKGTEDYRAFETIAFLRHSYRSQHQFRLPTLLRLTCVQKAIDPREKLYALRSLLKPKERDNPLLRADYNRPASEIHAKIASYIITEYQNLDILSYNCLFGDELLGPYWNMNLSNPDCSGRESLRSSWVPLAFDFKPLCPGIFNPEQSEIYNAGGRQLHKFSITRKYSMLLLTLEGVLVDRVAARISLKLLSILLDANFTSNENWETIFQNYQVDTHIVRNFYKAWEHFGEICWRTVCADRYLGDDGTVMRIPLQRERIPTLRNCWAWQKHELLHRVLIITEGGMLGLAPPAASKGDMVVVLFGAMIPFLVRDSRRRIQDDNIAGTYRLIGECYVHGIMDGEVLHAHEVGQCHSQMYRFV